MFSVTNQTYVGRVIFPAQEERFQNGKAYIKFVLYVSGVVRAKERGKQAESLKIPCSYIPQGDRDPVPHILCNIANKNDPNVGGLAGQSYKTVEVIVEGLPQFSQVEYNGKAVNGAFYLALNNTKVRVIDRFVLDLYQKEVGGGAEGSSGPVEGQGQAAQPARGTHGVHSSSPRVTPPKQGDIVRDATTGKQYRFIGTDPRNPAHYEPAGEAAPKQMEATKPQAAVQPAPAATAATTIPSRMVTQALTEGGETGLRDAFNDSVDFDN